MINEYVFRFESPASDTVLEIVDSATGEFEFIRDIPVDAQEREAEGQLCGCLYQRAIQRGVVVEHLVAIAEDFDFATCNRDELSEFLAVLIDRAEAAKHYHIGSVKGFVAFLER